MVRKVASLLRERGELDRRLANVTGAGSPDGLAAWLSGELWDVRTPSSGGPGVFAAGPLAGRSVTSVWAGDCQPDQHPEADFVLEYLTATPGLSVERVRLIARNGDSVEVFPRAQSPLDVDPAVAEGLRMLSSQFAPPLTRYH